MLRPLPKHRQDATEAREIGSCSTGSRVAEVRVGCGIRHFGKALWPLVSEKSDREIDRDTRHFGKATQGCPTFRKRSQVWDPTYREAVHCGNRCLQREAAVRGWAVAGVASVSISGRCANHPCYNRSQDGFESIRIRLCAPLHWCDRLNRISRVGCEHLDSPSSGH